jgi:hypothetical protein
VAVLAGEADALCQRLRSLQAGLTAEAAPEITLRTS